MFTYFVEEEEEKKHIPFCVVFTSIRNKFALQNNNNKNEKKK